MIDFIQLDPNGLCNAGCWFCPVSTLGNPKEFVNQMDVDLLYKIIKNIDFEKGHLVRKDLDFIFPAHYNEVLLYKNFEDFLRILDEFGLTVCILTNGVPLTPAKVDLINKYPKVVSQITINAPIFEKQLFEERTGMREDLFDKLISNIQYAEENFENNQILLIQINGIGEHSNLVPKKNFPNLKENELEIQYEMAKKLFPNLRIHTQTNLTDRVGLMPDVMENVIKEGTVVGCKQQRDTNWLHVNSVGDVFLCCNDYHMEYKFGNLKKQTISDIWLSPERTKVIEKAYKEICTKCMESEKV